MAKWGLVGLLILNYAIAGLRSGDLGCGSEKCSSGCLGWSESFFVGWEWIGGGGWRKLRGLHMWYVERGNMV